MSDGSGSGPRLKNLVFEAAVIIGSILAAFSIEAAWAERAERAQEAGLRLSLAADFQASRSSFEAAMARHRSTRDAADRLMRITSRTALTATDSDSLQVWIALVVNSLPSFEPANGTLEAVLNSGRADLIRDQDLMTELTRWTALVEDFVEEEESAIRHTMETLYPAFAERINLRDVPHPQQAGSAYSWDGPRGEPGPYDFLLEDEVQSILMRHWVLQQTAIEVDGPEVSAAIDRVTGLLQARSP